MELHVRNVNAAFSEIFWKLRVLNLEPEMTRNGPALVFPEPVTTVYKYPQERVLFHSGRDANPIFHVLEAVWMLAGRRDVQFLKHFNSTIDRYSDDGAVFNAAYGYRWRRHFGFDQLEEAIKMLRRDPATRQAVIQMWDADDFTKKTKDRCCNTQVVFEIKHGKLNMNVFNRSNDIWWGAYGANAVHFSFLQEFMATSVGVGVGVYRQISTNFHLYTELYDAAKYVKEPPPMVDLYANGAVRPAPLMLNGDYKSFFADCEKFCTDPFNTDAKYIHPFFTHVAQPMAMVSRIRKIHAGDGRGYAAKIRAEDWRKAVFDWIDRREIAKAMKE